MRWRNPFRIRGDGAGREVDRRPYSFVNAFVYWGRIGSVMCLGDMMIFCTGVWCGLRMVGMVRVILGRI